MLHNCMNWLILNNHLFYHGNSCAHEVNVVSTASVLPRTPGDINLILTVVFIGSGNFNPHHMGSMLKICKNKVWQSLIWLKKNNRLYQNMPLDASIMDLYSDKDEILHLKTEFFMILLQILHIFLMRRLLALCHILLTH